MIKWRSIDALYRILIFSPLIYFHCLYSFFFLPSLCVNILPLLLHSHVLMFKNSCLSHYPKSKSQLSCATDATALYKHNFIGFYAVNFNILLVFWLPNLQKSQWVKMLELLSLQQVQYHYKMLEILQLDFI